MEGDKNFSKSSLRSDSSDLPKYNWNFLVDIVEENGVPPHRHNSNATILNTLRKEIFDKYYAVEAQSDDFKPEELILSYWDEEFQEFVTLDSLEQLNGLERAKVRASRSTTEIPSLKKAQSIGFLKVSLEDAVLQMKDPNTGLKVKTRSLRLKNYTSCFTGSEAVEWMANKLSIDKKEAIVLGAKMVKEHYIHHVTYSSVAFEDKGHLYQFQDLGDMSRKNYMPKFDCNEVMLGFMSAKNGVVMRDRKDKWGLKKYKDCFTGTQAVDWISTHLNVRRNVAITIGTKLLNHGFFLPVSDSFPFADAPFLYTTMGGKRPNYEFPAERIVKLLQQLKAEDMFQVNRQDLDFVIDALTKGSGMNAFNVKIEDLLSTLKVDRETSSLVLSHTGSYASLPSVKFSKEEMKRSQEERNRSNSNPVAIVAHISDPILHLLEQCCDWNFDIFKLYELAGAQTMPLLALAVFKKNALTTKFNIDEMKLKNLFSEISIGYSSDNPYHNAIHASDVMQTVNFIITRGGFGQLLTDGEVLACIVAAAAHDMDHPGFNNAFMINSRSDLSILYNDQSVLENHHCARAFKAILKPENDIFTQLNKEIFTEVRRSIIRMILATDFGKHFDYVGQFKSTIANVDNVDIQKREIKDLYMEIAIKCADISHASKKLDLHLNWTNRVTEEFYHQGDEEKRLGMNVSPLMDRITGNVAKSQIGFINFMVMPLYEVWVEEFENFKECIQQLESNLEYWKSEVEKQNPQKQAEPKKEEKKEIESPKTDEGVGKSLHKLSKAVKKANLSTEKLPSDSPKQKKEKDGKIKRVPSDTKKKTESLPESTIGLLVKAASLSVGISSSPVDRSS